MKFCVIGVGRFGYYVATTLAEHSMDVLAVDSNETIIAEIKDKVTQAICMRVNDEEALRTIGIEDMDTVIVAMGENFAQSILVTAILKQKLKIPRVIVRSISSIHKEILELIGADQVILPEREVGIRLADSLSLPFNTLLRISSDLSLAQIKPPRRFIGQKLQDINLVSNYHITCVGIKDKDAVTLPDESYTISPNDFLFCTGNNRDLEKFTKL